MVKTEIPVVVSIELPCKTCVGVNQHTGEEFRYPKTWHNGRRIDGLLHLRCSGCKTKVVLKGGV